MGPSRDTGVCLGTGHRQGPCSLCPLTGQEGCAHRGSATLKSSLSWAAGAPSDPSLASPGVWRLEKRSSSGTLGSGHHAGAGPGSAVSCRLGKRPLWGSGGLGPCSTSDPLPPSPAFSLRAPGDARGVTNGSGFPMLLFSGQSVVAARSPGMKYGIKNNKD